MSHFFKDQALFRDLRAVQSAVLWEWAVTTNKSLPDAAELFVSTYKRIWPRIQLGDPFSDQNDRMFQLDAKSVLTILKKLEERYGKYYTRSATDLTKNLFQRVDFDLRPLATPVGGPVWCRNTYAPRQHAELLLRKYGVPEHMMPSRSPSILMINFFRGGSLTCEVKLEPMVTDFPPAAVEPILTLDFATVLAGRVVSPIRTAREPLRVGAAPYHVGEMPPPTGRALGGRTKTPLYDERAHSSSQTARTRMPLTMTLPPLDHGSLNSPLRGSPPLGSAVLTKLNALAMGTEHQELADAAGPGSPISVIQHELRQTSPRVLV